MLNQRNGRTQYSFITEFNICTFCIGSESHWIAKKKCQEERVARKQRRCGQSSTLLTSHSFTSAVQEGPDYVCVCCNRLMYRKTVQQFQVSNYDKAPSDFVVTDVVSAQNKQWICKTRHGGLKRGRLPAQAKANKLDLDSIPVELSELNPLETHLICLRIPFMNTSLRQAACHPWTSCQCTN